MKKTILSTNSTYNETMTIFVSCMVFLTAGMTLSIDSGYSYGPVLLCLASVVLLFKERIWQVLDARDWWLIGVFVLYFAVNVGGRLYHGYPGSPTTNSNRFFLATLILPILLKYPPRAGFLWAGLVVGCISGFVVAIWQTSIQGLGRAHGYVHPIQFGDFSILMGFFCLVGLLWAHQNQQPTRYKVALVIGAVAGLGASLLSGSRGGWLLVPILPIVFAWIYRKQLSAKAVAIPALGVAIVVAALVALPTTHISKRISTATDEVEMFMHGTGSNTSVGARLTMWRNALKIIPDRPIIGWGELGYKPPLLAQIKDPDIKKIISQFSHVHNGILDATAKRGAIGLIALLLLYIVPFILFWRHMRRDKRNVFVLGGMTTAISFFVFGWTEVMFSHNNSNILYAFYIIVFWAFIVDPRNQTTGEDRMSRNDEGVRRDKAETIQQSVQGQSGFASHQG